MLMYFSVAQAHTVSGQDRFILWPARNGGVYYMCRWVRPLHTSIAASPDSHEDLSPPGFCHSKLHNLTVLIRVLWRNRIHRMNLFLSHIDIFMRELSISLNISLISHKCVCMCIYTYTYIRSIRMTYRLWSNLSNGCLPTEDPRIQ